MDKWQFEDWQRILDLNLTQAFILTKRLGAAMIPRRWGRIINISSINAFWPGKAMRGRSYETSIKTNAFWLGRLQSAKLLGRDPLLILHRLERIDAVTPALLQESFKKYFPMNRYTVVTLMPEKKAQQP